ncbi:cytolethal distending toxin, subunit CdtC [Campylobacter subantarcticus LMG 24377]|uniref:Cytolethal distending toxin, subunit CdtC n=1 Tax=Campylobacter subantarcticus TaxID=497724 RepID=A0ABW9N589_9BACT|nr:cytolethal distending toxin, subunit CdtC [Campylobacter subantarcticus]AJC93147.1 cytolethal distending toxin, subunit CdtC [Campylobacter subantarcticus LMG 24377]EAL3938717.1 cytolethal distending toxin, subunit CdtC [Campylobacter lari]EAL3939844.1 cytolethal distending toxin, subunit CdtC [Campylobacter lari]MPB99443.1 cytolethal distending toxin, subunit CdtC [Campylobacter subantarcticus]
MKKILIILNLFLSFIFALDESTNSTSMLSIRSLETGISLSPFRETSQDLRDQNWVVKEIVLDEKLKARDKMAERLPFGYVQFTNPINEDVCLAIAPDGFFTGKSCSLDLQTGELETVFSIMPTTTSAVQIRSLVLNSDECIITFFNPNVPVEYRFGLGTCTIDPAFFAELNELMILTPPLINAKPLE